MNYNLRSWTHGVPFPLKVTRNNTIKREFEVVRMEADGSHKEQLTIPSIYQKHHLAKMNLWSVNDNRPTLYTFFYYYFSDETSETTCNIMQFGTRCLNIIFRNRSNKSNKQWEAMHYSDYNTVSHGLLY